MLSQSLVFKGSALVLRVVGIAVIAFDRNRLGPAVGRAIAAAGAWAAKVTSRYQLTSRSGVAPMRWMERSAPSYSSSWLRRRPSVAFSPA
jgi:crotonobetainyl-CoA:carnitine CoA-transferase CaiB-like acyl-CoA transferase